MSLSKEQKLEKRVENLEAIIGVIIGNTLMPQEMTDTMLEEARTSFMQKSGAFGGFYADGERLQSESI